MSRMRYVVRRVRSESDASWTEPKRLPPAPWAAQGANANHPEQPGVTGRQRDGGGSAPEPSREPRQRGRVRLRGDKRERRRTGSTLCRRESRAPTASFLFQHRAGMLLACWAASKSLRLKRRGNAHHDAVAALMLASLPLLFLFQRTVLTL